MAAIVKGWIEGYKDGIRQQFKSKASIAWTRQPAILLLHTTEGSNYPSAATYRDGQSAPHLTIDILNHTFRQHYPFTQGGWALKAQGAKTNSSGALQFELIGTSDPRSKAKPFVGDLSDDDLLWLGTLLKFIADEYGIPFTSGVTWVPYPKSYGVRAAQRLNNAAWYAYRGILGHQHVPGGNSHGDPGDFPVERMIALVNNVIPVTPPSGPIGGPITPTVPAQPPVPRKEFPAIPLVVDGDFGARSVTALQIVLPKEYNNGVNLRPDGDLGTITKKAMQRWLKALGEYKWGIDGVFGRDSIKALQRFLAKKGKDVGPDDGVWGERTTRALQSYLNDQRQYL